VSAESIPAGLPRCCFRGRPRILLLQGKPNAGEAEDPESS
jgi:hypothetical protein